MTAHTADIVISGGGLVGLALAIAISKTLGGEFAVAVVDPGPLDPERVRPDARARAFGTASIRLLTAIGVWDHIAPAGERVTAIDITDSGLSDGIRPTLLSYDPGTEPDGMVIVENAPVMRALLMVARSSPGVTMLSGKRVVSHVADQMRLSTIGLDDGAHITAPLAVAGDGRASRLRDLAGIKCTGWAYQQAGIVTTVAFELPHEGRAVQHFLPGGPFALLPLPGQRACITWSEDAATAQQLMSADDETFRLALEQRAGGKLGRIRLAGPRQSWPLELHLARTLAANRVALIGDAARSVHPLAGQGLNLGLRDVAALAEVTEDAARTGQDIGVATTLERYERWRRADGAMSAAAFDGLNRLFSNDWTVLRTARQAGLGAVERLPGIKQMLVGEAAGLTGTLPRLMR